MKSALLMLISALALTACQTTSSDSGTWTYRIVGTTYEGVVENGDDLVPSKTSFTVDDKGVLRGNYEVAENDKPYLGKLDNCQAFSDRFVSCDWTDKYGTGILNVIFSSDKNTFLGTWSTAQDADMYLWSGAKP